MTVDRFDEVERICLEALEQAPDRRTAFLDEACRDDADLRAQVDHLLAGASNAEQFLETPPAEPVAPALRAGDHLGPYEVVARTGAGGMGEVYKARDTRLARDVALKILPASYASDPLRRARFEREAKTIGGLNHPHICTLHDIGHHHGQTFLVMEYLVGESLEARLARGRLPLEQAMAIAAEIADALAAAHRHGVIHRDLKPGNVILTKSGAKLLDFGLAKLKRHGEERASAFQGASGSKPTLTAEGLILGTLQYMAPEQVEGRPVDVRTDLWALGAILYEMVAGKRAFEGTSPASLMSAILEHEPAPLAPLQPLAPPALDRLVRQCLAKAPDDRPDTAHDVANDLRWVRESGGATALNGARPRRRLALRGVMLVAAVAVVALSGAGLMSLLRPSVPQLLPVHSILDVRPADELNGGGERSSYLPTPGGSRTALAWTPDGRKLVFVGRRGGVQQLYVRQLDADEARPLPGTEGAQAPVVSPDGQWVAFFAGGAIRRIALTGGPPTELLRRGYAPYGLAWDDQNRLFFGAEDDRIWMIPPAGVAVPVTTVLEGEITHVQPSPLPGGRAFLYTVRKGRSTWGGEDVVAQNLTTGTRTVVLKNATDARYVPTGHLVFMRWGTLFAVRFDATRLEVRGEEHPVLGGVGHALVGNGTFNLTGAGQFAFAPCGTLAWIPGPISPFEEAHLVTVDRRGRVTSLPGDGRSYEPPLRRSPDGRLLALRVRSLSDISLWIYDVARKTSFPLVTEGEVASPIWWPDGQHLLFKYFNRGRRSLVFQSLDGAAPVELSRAMFQVSSATPTGQVAGFGMNTEGMDILVARIEGGRATIEPFARTPQNERWAEFSPDGRWLAFGSDLSRRWEVYVQPYPGPGVPVPVSLQGGGNPAWNPNGREIFFVDHERAQPRMMAASFAPGSPPRVGEPKELFSFDPRELMMLGWPVRVYDVTPDGQAFYAVRFVPPPPPPPVTRVNLVLNWFEELKAKVPSR